MSDAVLLPRIESTFILRDEDQHPQAAIVRDPHSGHQVLYRLEELDAEEIAELINRGPIPLSTLPRKRATDAGGPGE